MIKVAIAGNIASGKSTVESILRELGYKILDTDNVCHSLLVSCSEVTKAFSAYDVFSDGKISREKLGKLVFANKNLKKKLEDILYPKVKTVIRDFFIQNKSERIIFVAIPLLFEAGMEDIFDKILFIYCEDSLRLQRLIDRNGYSEEYAKLRMNSQMSQDLKVKKSDWVIYNNSTKESLRSDIVNLVEQIR